MESVRVPTGNSASRASTPYLWARAASALASAEPGATSPVAAWISIGGRPVRSADSGSTTGSSSGCPARYMAAQLRASSSAAPGAIGLLDSRVRRSEEVDQGQIRTTAPGCGEFCFASVSSNERTKSAAGRVAGDRDLLGRDAPVEQPLVRAQGVIDGGGERVLGSEAIVREEDAGSCRHRDRSSVGPVPERRPEDVPAAMEVKNGCGRIFGGGDEQRRNPARGHWPNTGSEAGATSA